MIFKRYKIAALKKYIWDVIHDLQQKTETSDENVTYVVNYIYTTFNELSGKDSEIKYNNNNILKLYDVSLGALRLILENYSKDKHFNCLKVLSDLVCVDLWQRAYSGLGNVDMSIVTSVENFIKEEKGTILKYCGEIASQDNLFESIKQLENGGDSASLKSLKLRYINGSKLIVAYETELNAKLEEMIAAQQKGAVNSAKVLSSFKYSEEVFEENNKEFEKIQKASDVHYAPTRAYRELFLIEKQNDNNAADPELDVVEKEIGSKETILEHIQSLIDRDNPDIVGAFANLRFIIDSYAKYVCGIDFSMNFDGRKVYLSKDTFNVMFGYDNGKRINDIWDKSSDIIHGGDEQLALNLNPDYIASLKEKALGFAKTLEELIGNKLDNIDFIDSVKRLYSTRYEETQKYVDGCKEREKEPSKALKYSKKQLDSYKNFLIEKGVEQSFFDNYPEID